MSKKLARILKTELSADLPLPAVAEMVRKKGRGRDTILAHITPREAKKLKREGGRGSINPDTGLPEFDDGGFEDYSFAAPAVAGPDVAGAPSPEAATQAAGLTAADVGAGTYAPTNGGDVTFTPGFGDASQVAQPVNTLPSGLYPLGAVGQKFTPSSTDTSFAGTPIITPPSGMSQVFSPEGASYNVPSEQVPGSAASEPAAPPPKPDPPKPSLWDRLTTTENLLKLGGVAGLGGLGFLQSLKAASQAKQAKAEQVDLGAPYRAQGQQLISQAQAGQLTPDAQQALQAAAAQLQQSGVARGGVGAQQAAAQLANLRASLLQKQYDYGLQVSGIADQITIGAIQSGLQANQAIAQAQGQFGQALFSVLGSMPGKTVP